MLGSQKGETETDGLYQSRHMSLRHCLVYSRVTKWDEKAVKKVTYLLLLCVFKTQTSIPELLANLLMDFDASVPIDQNKPSFTAERALVHGSS
jgi:hypothetical protein